MSIYSNVTEQDLINLRKLAEQQKNERALKIRNKILKQTHDKKLADSLSPITEKLDEVRDDIKKSKPNTPQLAITNTQTPAIENTTVSQSLRDTLAFMKKRKIFFKLEQDGNEVFWNKVPIKALGENRISIKDQEYDIKLNIQEYFTNTKLTTKNMNDEDKSIIYDILRNTGFYSMRPKKGKQSARTIDARNNLPNAVAKIRNPSLRTIENTKSSSDLEGQGVKIIIPSNIIDIYTRLEVLPGLKLSGHTDTLTEASNSIDELYKRGEIQNKQQYRNALNKFSK